MQETRTMPQTGPIKQIGLDCEIDQTCESY